MQNQPVTILVDSNNQLPLPDFSNVFSGSNFISASVNISNFSSSFQSASKLLDINKTFLTKEIGAFIQFQNNLSETPFGYSASYYEKNILRDVNAIIYDITNNTTIRTNKTAKAYYDKNGNTIIPEGQVTASINAIEYANILASEIIKNKNVLSSSLVSRLYQTTFTQSYNSEYALIGSSYTASAYLVGGLYEVIRKNIKTPNLVDQDIIELVKNVEIPTQDSLNPVVAGKLVMEDGYSLIFSGSTDLKVILSILESANE